MRLIIGQYLASLAERDELDAILPDLLSQLGLLVFSRPGRGTRQQGVDVAAVGRLDREPEAVHLFTIKAGDLTRQNWSGSAVQSLRPSLEEILDSYIPNRIPVEHQGKPVAVHIVLSGDVREQVSEQLEGFKKQAAARSGVTIDNWNGDVLAKRIEECFLREELVPKDARVHLRKSLALLEEPDVSYQHFAVLIRSLGAVDVRKPAKSLRALRQMSVCLWILFAWARDADNLEAAYLSSELALLHGWLIVRAYMGRTSKQAGGIQAAFLSLFSTYQTICSEFLSTNVLPHVGKSHALSCAVRGSSSLDINLKLFDILGRVALDGIWAYWLALRYPDREADAKERALAETMSLMTSTTELVWNNPALLLPIRDDQAIDLAMAMLLLAFDPANYADMTRCLREMIQRATFAYQTHGRYPCALRSYEDLLDHPKASDDEYRREVTSGSILYPTIGLWAALLGDGDTYSAIAELKNEHMGHCNFQLWYPDEESESKLYPGDVAHGKVLCDVCVDRPPQELLEQVFGECDSSPEFRELSAVRYGWWPLILVACRHYRLPVPPHLLEGLRPVSDGAS